MSGDGTRTVHAGLLPPAPGQPLGPVPIPAATYALPGEPSGDYVYGRYANPTWSALEAALGELEGGTALSFSSGMAAVSAVLLSVLRPGDVLVLADDCYYTVRSLVAEQLPQVQVRTAPSSGAALADLVAGARLVWAETPSNPWLDVTDVRAVAEAAHAAGALLAVDGTTATPLGQSLLDLGADYAVASDTKALTGHSDVLLGHVATRDDALLTGVRRWRDLTGAVPGAFEAWLAHRSLLTLDVRLARQAATALALADALAGHPLVADVRHPWRPGDPSYDLARRQMRRGNGMVSFTLPSAEQAQRFLAAARLVTEATSFGGVHTTAERRGRWGGDAVPPGFVRLSCGLEDAADLISDVQRALDAAA